MDIIRGVVSTRKSVFEEENGAMVIANDVDKVEIGNMPEQPRPDGRQEALFGYRTAGFRQPVLCVGPAEFIFDLGAVAAFEFRNQSVVDEVRTRKVIEEHVGRNDERHQSEQERWHAADRFFVTRFSVVRHP
ncbi:MAG: hypothetical protein HY897_15445 [Deltaproteobacteria bacterium]|nr:hypothetical protein [Deltaproteobacteria bacterium]